MRSLCDDRPDDSLTTIARLIQSHLSGFCLGHPVPEDAQCVMEEELPSSDACPSAHVDRGVRDGHRYCQICREGDGVTTMQDANERDLSACAPMSRSDDVWQYVGGIEVGCPRTGTIEFRGASAPPGGATVRLRCLVEQCAAEAE